MKQVEFKTSKGEFLAIEFPQGLVPRRGDVIERTWVLPRLPEGKWLLICRADEIYEEQAKEVVSSLVKNKEGVKSYVYTLIQLLQAGGVYFENPLGDKPIITREKIKIFGRLYEVDKNAVELDMWETEQSKVWNKPQTYLFKKV